MLDVGRGKLSPGRKVALERAIYVRSEKLPKFNLPLHFNSREVQSTRRCLGYDAHAEPTKSAMSVISPVGIVELDRIPDRALACRRGSFYVFACVQSHKGRY